MTETGPRQPSRQGSGRPPPKGPPPAPRPTTTEWGQTDGRAPRYAGPPGTPYQPGTAYQPGATYPPGATYLPPGQRVVAPQGRATPRPPVTPPGQRPRPPAGPVRPTTPRPDGAAAVVPARTKAVVVRGARSRRMVRRLDVWSVFKVSVVLYACVFVVMLIAGSALWNVAAAFGIIDSTDKLVRSLFALTSFRLHPLTALVWGSLIGGAVCFLGVLFNVLAAVVYNLISDVVGGVQVVVVGDQTLEESV